MRKWYPCVDIHALVNLLGRIVFLGHRNVHDKAVLNLFVAHHFNSALMQCHERLDERQAYPVSDSFELTVFSLVKASEKAFDRLL